MMDCWTSLSWPGRAPRTDFITTAGLVDSRRSRTVRCLLMRLAWSHGAAHGVIMTTTDTLTYSWQTTMGGISFSTTTATAPSRNFFLALPRTMAALEFTTWLRVGSIMIMTGSWICSSLAPQEKICSTTTRETRMDGWRLNVSARFQT